MKKILTTLACILIFTWSFGETKLNSKQVSSLRELKNKYNNNFYVEWNSKNGTPDFISYHKGVVFDKDQYVSVSKFMKEIKNLICVRNNKDTLTIYNK
jgi:hypothetical protein